MLKHIYVMRTKKYIGGSRQSLFILPEVGYNSTRARVNALLEQIAKEMQDKAQNSAIPLCTSAETTFSTKAINKAKVEPITYVCGCTVVDGLFRRQAGCSKAKVQH